MGKNQDPGSGINIPDPQHWMRIHLRLLIPWIHNPDIYGKQCQDVVSLSEEQAACNNTALWQHPRGGCRRLLQRRSPVSNLGWRAETDVDRQAGQSGLRPGGDPLLKGQCHVSLNSFKNEGYNNIYYPVAKSCNRDETLLVQKTHVLYTGPYLILVLQSVK